MLAFMFLLWFASLALYVAIDHFLDARALWRAILTPWRPDQGEWRRVHVLAHLIGGVVLAVIVRFAPFLDETWRADALHRALMVWVFQFAWEYIQIENWRFADHPQPSSYPYWSAFWDLGLVLIGFGLVEIVL